MAFKTTRISGGDKLISYSYNPNIKLLTIFYKDENIAKRVLQKENIYFLGKIYIPEKPSDNSTSK